MKIGYKIFLVYLPDTRSVLGSYTRSTEGLGIIYEKNKFNKPKQPDCPLFIFDTLNDVLNCFGSTIDHRAAIYKVVYKPYQGKLHYTLIRHFPKGISFAEAVRLIEEIKL